ncbi:MAG: response regulator, partial [Nitrospirales bacterium]|nr:response regulator [Nitrospirales bacterium]
MKTLIVDDNAENRYFFEILVKKRGDEFVSATNGIEALEKLRQGQIDLIISDILMPRMDGYRLCRECKQDDRLKEIPFLFITAAYTDEKDEEFSLALGADRFIRRPIEADALIGIIDEVMAEKISGRAPLRPHPLPDETRYLSVYTERLTSQLEKKVRELEAEISVRKHAEEALKEQAKSLMRSNRELEQFAYIASHDLQEPLRRIISFTELLAGKYRDALDEKAKSYIDIIVSGARRMSTLINDLLAYSRLTTRAKDLSPTDSSSVLKRVLSDLSIRIEESGAVVSFDSLPTVMADDSQLGQLFQNLIGNAIKFRGAESPRITVSALSVADFLRKNTDIAPEILDHLQRMEKGWVFSVADNGIGIEPQYHNRIFEVFQRLHTEEEYSGTGIGLSVCRKVVERHGGDRKSV